MKNYKSEESGVVNFTAPAGGVMGGSPELIGDLLIVPHHDAAEGELASGMYRGEFELAKAAADAPGQFEAAYWNDGASEITTAADDGGEPNKPVGFFTYPAIDGDTTACVMLTGQIG
ncbi:DUF2190 family protein [Oceanospirillum maris]|uniref:DUF2190 family protein n=1 Tax=Oceanospirillum maris TaxID=64977 RepID=UPI000686AC96|nr:DUF2190 family protein [Oceanospirillum maris]